MKKRILCLLLVFCLVLPISAFADEQDNGVACFNYFKDHLKQYGTLKDGVFTYQGKETMTGTDGKEAQINIIVSYYPGTDTLGFGVETNQSGVSYSSEVRIRASLQMPYDAVQHLTALGMTYENEGKISSDFTTKSKVELSGETFGTEQLFPYTIALALRHAQDRLLSESDYTIADLGFTALYEELYPSKPCDGGDSCPSKIFTDVNRALWYHHAIDWAVTTGVTNGVTKTTFCPDESCTRGQMVTFLWRAMGEPEPELQSSSFVDVPADQYYAKAVLWAVENNITTGIDTTHFAPKDTVTRAQTVTFLWRLKQEPVPSGSQSFPDVPAGKYYASAVTWAVENNITNGMGNGLFEPNANCTRAQIVTFLYRAVAG